MTTFLEAWLKSVLNSKFSLYNLIKITNEIVKKSAVPNTP